MTQRTHNKGMCVLGVNLLLNNLLRSKTQGRPERGRAGNRFSACTLLELKGRTHIALGRTNEKIKGIVLVNQLWVQAGTAPDETLMEIFPPLRRVSSTSGVHERCKRIFCAAHRTCLRQ